MAFMQLMFTIEEQYDREIKKNPDPHPAATFLVNNIDNMFKKRSLVN